MHVWNVLHAARWKYWTQKIAILAPSHIFVGLYLRSWGTYRQLEKDLLNIDTSPTCPHNMVNLRPPNSWDLLASLGHPCKFQRVSRLGSITAQHSSTRHQRSAKLCGVEQRAPPMFSRATITLGIGPHSSWLWSPSLGTFVQSKWFQFYLARPVFRQFF